MTLSLDSPTAGRMKTILQAARYGVVGVLNTGIDVALFFVLIHYAHLDPVVATVISYSVAAANSFTINRLWTFSGRSRSGSALREAAVFAGVTLLGVIVQAATLAVVQPVAGVIAAKVCATLTAFAATFWLNKRVTFNS